MEGTRKSLSFVLLVLFLVNCSSASDEYPILCQGNVCELHNISSVSELFTKLSKFSNQTAALASSNISELICVNTTLEQIPAALMMLFPKLQKFTASQVGLQEIGFEGLKNSSLLTHLDLSANNLSRVDLKAFKHIKHLRLVDLSSNRINSIIDSPVIVSGNSTLAEISKIGFLNLQDNKLKIFNVASMEFSELNLNNNKLEKLFPSLKVEVLKVDNNKLKEFYITETMVNVSAMNNVIKIVKCDENLSLEELNLAGNEIDNDALKELKLGGNLKVLDVSNTMLSTLPTDFLAELKSLETLNLAHTKVNKFPFGLFSQQISLKYLNIADNNLDFIDCRWFRPLISLTTCDISENKLIRLQNCENFNEMFPKLKMINVRGNSWTCKYLNNLDSLFSSLGVEFLDTAREVTVIDAFDIEEASDQLENFIQTMKKFFGPLHAPKFNAGASVKEPFFFVLNQNFQHKINIILGKPRDTYDAQNLKIYEKFWEILIDQRAADASNKSLPLRKINVECGRKDVIPKKTIA